ncbi:MAG TPA: hypothetical protein VF662_13395, partial [Allosphingosinicella sp.]
AQAQIDRCNALLEHGISNLRTQTSENTYLSVIKDHYCSTSYDSMSNDKKLSFSAVVKSIPVGLSGSSSSARDKHQQFCRDFQTTVSTSSQEYLNTVQIQGRALDAWNRCQQLASRNLEVTMTPLANNSEVDFQLLWRGTGTSRLRGVDTTNMSCMMDGGRLGGNENITLSGQSARSVRCTRRSEQIPMNGVNAKYYPDANVKLKTQEGDYLMEFADMVNGPADTRFKQLEAEIARAHLEMAAYRAVLQNATGAPVSRFEGRRDFAYGGSHYGSETSCATGSYVTGFAIQDADTGSKCQPCISNILVTCSRLPAAGQATP